MKSQMEGAGVGQGERLFQREGMACAALQRPECGRGEERKEGGWAGASQSLPSPLWHHPSIDVALEPSPHC